MKNKPTTRKQKSRSSHESDSSDSQYRFLPETTDVNALLDELMPAEKTQRFVKAEDPEDSIENHLAFLEGIEQDLSNQESGDQQPRIEQETSARDELRLLKKRFNSMYTLNAAGPKVLRGKARTVRRRALLESCVRDLAEVCGPNTKEIMMEDKLRRQLSACESLGNSTLIVGADKLHLFMQASCDQDRQRRTGFSMRKLKVNTGGKQEVVLQLIKEPADAGQLQKQQPVDFKKPADFADALMDMHNEPEQTVSSSVVIGEPTIAQASGVFDQASDATLETSLGGRSAVSRMERAQKKAQKQKEAYSHTRSKNFTANPEELL